MGQDAAIPVAVEPPTTPVAKEEEMEVPLKSDHRDFAASATVASALGVSSSNSNSNGWKVGPEDFTPTCVIGQGKLLRTVRLLASHLYTHR